MLEITNYQLFNKKFQIRTSIFSFYKTKYSTIILKNVIILNYKKFHFWSHYYI